MYPLLEIKMVPIEIEFNISNSRFQQKSSTAELEIRRDEGGVNIKSRPIRLQLDTFEARNSMAPTAARSVEHSAGKGKQAAYEATAAYARQGKLFLQAKVGEDVIPQLSEQKALGNLENNVGLTFLPESGIDISWQEGDMQIQYQMDKLNFEWKMESGNFEFVPGDIEISVKQQPDVIIKYVGGAIYVPPSSDPNYQEIDVRA